MAKFSTFNILYNAAFLSFLEDKEIGNLKRGKILLYSSVLFTSGLVFSAKKLYWFLLSPKSSCPNSKLENKYFLSSSSVTWYNPDINAGEELKGSRVNKLLLFFLGTVIFK